MKFAILSDVHGNIFALQECFKLIDKMDIDSVIWCGDYITDIPRSHEVIEFIKDSMKRYITYIIRGNREDYIISYEHSEKQDWSMENRYASLLCSYNELHKDDIEFISMLPETCTISIINVPKIFISHSVDYNNGNDCSYKIFGHSHKQHIFCRDSIKYLNPGSIGLTTSGTPGADFIILDINQDYSKIQNIHINYNISKPVSAIKQNILDKTSIKWGDALIKLLETGIDYPALYLKETLQIANEYGIANLDETPLEIWQIARNNLKI